MIFLLVFIVSSLARLKLELELFEVWEINVQHCHQFWSRREGKQEPHEGENETYES